MSTSLTLKEDPEQVFQTQLKAAKYAALFYFLLAILGAFGIAYFDSLIDWDDPAKTADNLTDSETMVRLSIISGLLGQIAFIFLGLAFYQLFKPVNKNTATIMLVLVLVSVPITMLTAVSTYGAIYLLTEPEYMRIFGEEQLYSLVMIFLKINEAGWIIAGFFWGLWLFPLGYLAYTSGYFPKFIGIFLMLGCISYVIDSVVYFISSSGEEITEILVTVLSGIGEISMVLWLLFRGPKIPKPAEKSA